MTVIIAPANGSFTTRAPASARTAMTSTLSRPRRIDPTIQPTENTRPSTVPAIHNMLAAVAADSNHATPPATSNTVDTANSARSLFAPNQVTADHTPQSYDAPATPRHAGAGTGRIRGRRHAPAPHDHTSAVQCVQQPTPHGRGEGPH